MYTLVHHLRASYYLFNAQVQGTEALRGMLDFCLIEAMSESFGGFAVYFKLSRFCFSP
jgi:hypothetical protein